MTSSRWRARVIAPAKVNLGLRVVGRRADGYHLLDSVFAPLDLADEIEIEIADDGSLESRVDLELEPDALASDVPADHRNLAVRAAAAFLQATDLRVQVRLRLLKRIPAAAGLGGGSSDAGAVLAELARRYPGRLSPGELSATALRLGADVPFFLDPRPARVTGIGEHIEPLAALPRLALALVNPGNSLATAQVYGVWDKLSAALTTAGAGSTLPPVPGRWASLPTDEVERVGRLEGLLVNDLESAALHLCPALAGLKQRLLEAGALVTSMSGSGATVFGVFRDEGQASRGLARAGFEPPVWTRVAVVAGAG